MKNNLNFSISVIPITIGLVVGSNLRQTNIIHHLNTKKKGKPYALYAINMQEKREKRQQIYPATLPIYVIFRGTILDFRIG